MTARKRFFLPRLERLETRWCPAVDVAIAGRSIIIRGDAGDDTITITDDGAGAVSATIVGPGGTDTAAGTNIQNIFVYGSDGNDIVNYTLTGVLGQRRALYLYLGNGNDSADLNFTAGLDTAFLYVTASGWNGDDSVTATFGPITRSTVNLVEYLHRNNDTARFLFNGTIEQSNVTAFANVGYENDDFDVDLNAVHNSRVIVNAWLAPGDDTMDARLLGAITGASVVSVNCWDGYGNDTVTFQAAGVGVGAGSTLALTSYSFQGNDTVNLTYSGEVDGALTMLIAGGMASDNFSANVTIDAGSTGRFLGKMIGWWAPDILTFNVVDNSVGALAFFFAYLDGGWFGGNTCTHTSNVRAVNC